MAIDKASLQKALKESKERSAAAGGYTRYFEKDATTSLRIVAFVQEDLDVEVFAREFPHWRVDGVKFPIPHRGLWDQPDFLADLEDREGRQENIKLRSRYLMRAINIDQSPPVVETWDTPVSVWEAIAGVLLDEEYEDALDPETGVIFKVTRSGSGLDTKYDVVVGRKSWPVPTDLAENVEDPIHGIKDPGYVGQIRMLGLDPDQYPIPEGQGEDIPFDVPEVQPKKKTSKKKTTKKSGKKTTKKANGLDLSAIASKVVGG